MAVTAIFRKGKTSLDVAAAPFAVHTWTPPGIIQEYNISSGTSANRYGGGSLVGSRLANRTFGLTLRILATSEQALRSHVRQVIDYTRSYDDPVEPLYFEFKPNALPTPSWGQFGAPLRYEVVGCTWNLGSGYQTEKGRASGYTLEGMLEVKPAALGLRQQLFTGVGGINADYASTDGRSRGMVLGEATTNLVTNPVFGAATYSTGWTAGASLVVAQNKDPQYILYGLSSVYLTATAATNVSYYRTINLGDTDTYTLSAYVRRKDGAAVTSADVLIRFGTIQTPAYTALGGGWYKLSITAAGQAAGVPYGITVQSGYSVYLSGLQLEKLDYATPFCYGDLPGCAWTSTAHASTSTRTGASIKRTLADVFHLPAFSVSVTFKADCANTISRDMVMFDTRDGGHTTSVWANFESTDDKIYLTDGTNTISSAAQTIAVGDVINYVFTGGPAGLAIYKNGSATPIASGATYTYPSAGASLFLNSNYSAANQILGTVYGITLYDKQLSATEAAAVGTAALAAANAGHRVDWMPVLWTADGDNTVDSDLEYALAAGIPGSLDAVTEFVTEVPVAAAGEWTTLWLSRFTQPFNAWRKISGSFVDTSSTIDGGGAYKKIVTPELYQGREVMGFIRCTTTKASAINIRTEAQAITQTITSAIRQVDPDTTKKGLFAAGMVYVPVINRFQNEVTYLTMAIRETGGGAGTTTHDNIHYLPRPLCRVVNTGATGSSYDFLGLMGKEAHSLDETYTFQGFLPVDGDPVELAPGVWNALLSLVGNSTETSLKTRTVIYLYAYVTPRWGLI